MVADGIRQQRHESDLLYRCGGLLQRPLGQQCRHRAAGSRRAALRGREDCNGLQIVEHMKATSFVVNGKKAEVTVDPNTPLLWVIREHLKLTGTKFGCGIAQCGACTVHVNGDPLRYCVTPVSSVAGKSGQTNEGI